jgi:hypothetical protein
MDLLVRVFLIAMIVIGLLFIAFVLVQRVAPNSLTQDQAVSLIKNDLQIQNPSANITITGVSPSLYPGSWHIVASVTSNSTSPCPSYSVDSFDYPQFSFVNGTDNIYTKWDSSTQTCYVYGAVSSAPSAVAESYSLNIPLIRSYVRTVGFYNVSVGATYYTSLTAAGNNYTNAWLVRYSSSRLNYSAYALLKETSGSPLGYYTQSNS